MVLLYKGCGMNCGGMLNYYEAQEKGIETGYA